MSMRGLHGHGELNEAAWKIIADLCLHRQSHSVQYLVSKESNPQVLKFQEVALHICSSQAIALQEVCGHLCDARSRVQY